MPEVRLQDYGTARPKLLPEDLETSPCLLTIEAAEEIEVKDPTTRTGVRLALTLTFEELPGKRLWLNRGQIETLTTRLGSNSDFWVGAPIPVETHVAEFKGQRFPKVRVMPAEAWDAFLAAEKQSSPRRPVAKAPRGRK